MSNKTGYDLNSLIIIGNITVCALSIYLYSKIGGNRYVDISTVILLCIFGAGNLLILLYEKKKRDPFILLLLLITLGFYMGRVVTLLYDPWSRILAMFSFTSDDLNYSLIFIMLSNVSIVLGLSMAGGNIPYIKKGIINSYTANTRKIIVIILFAVLISYCLQLLPNTFSRFAGYIMLFVNLEVLLLFTFTYLAMNFSKISNTNRIVLLIWPTIFILTTTLSGSRSALLAMAFFIMFAIISLKGKIILNKKILLLSVTIIPVSLILYISATYLRDRDVQYLAITKRLTILKEADLIGSNDIRSLLRPIFERIGYLDYSAILIRNQERFSKIINFQYYFESIIDNALTPGFNVFDTIKISLAIPHVSRMESIPTHREKRQMGYHSTMPTVYGEYYVLFYGYLALIFLFISSYIFKKIYLSIRSKDALLFYLYRALVFYVFFMWLTSFGMDSVIFDLSCIIISVGLLKSFYKIKMTKRTYL